MKFGKNLIRVVELSDPEWGPFWINYKYLKKKIKEIVKQEGLQKVDSTRSTDPETISKSALEKAFFRLILTELKKVSDFFKSAEQQFEIRIRRVREGYQQMRQQGVVTDPKMWTRLLSACVKLYKEILLLENFAIMNFCGFSKILKKHDKITGYQTREAFMRKVVSEQPFTHYALVLDMLQESERLFTEIQQMQTTVPLRDEERLFIEAIRSLNFQASRLQAEETGDINDGSASSDDGSSKVASKICPPPLLTHVAQRLGEEENKASDNNSFNKSARLFPHRKLESHTHADMSVSPTAGLDDAATVAEAAALRANRSLAEGDSNTAISWMQQVARDASSSEPLITQPHIHAAGAQPISFATDSQPMSFVSTEMVAHKRTRPPNTTSESQRNPDSATKRQRSERDDLEIVSA